MAEHRLTGYPPYGAIQPTRTWKLAALFALFVLLSAVALGVSSALKEPDAASLWRSMLCGLLAAWMLTFTRQPAWRAVPVLFLAGPVYILLFPGGLIANLRDILNELVRMALPVATFQWNASIDFTALVGLMRNLTSAAEVILARVLGWVLSLRTNDPVFDPVAAALVWNSVIWSVSAWAGWIVEARRSTLLAVLPAILLGVGTFGYARRMSFTLYVVLGATLLVVAFVQQAARQQRWNLAGLAYPRRKGWQIAGVAALLAVGLVMLSGTLSSISVRRIEDWLSEYRKPAARQEDHLAVSLGIVSNATAVPDAISSAQRAGLPRDRLIGSGPELSQRVVMTVAVRDVFSSVPVQQPPLYWRSYTYDVYMGQGWSSSPTRRSVYLPDQHLMTDYPAARLLVQQTIYPVEDLGGTLYAAGEPVTIDALAEAAWRSPADLFGVQTEKSSSYEALSMMPLADETMLRAAGQKYPDWVRQRFLALPSSLPGRVRALAAQLTASRSTPYDRARAIEGYLRQYPYTLNVARPPVNHDVVDYFLFDLKQGYCDYYASAMVVLARASGVPARLAVGYASGSYNLNSRRYIVTEADAHSWVEIYFPGIGWVPFEPTASRPALQSPRIPLSESSGSPLPPAETPQTKHALLPWPGIVGAVVALVGLLVFASVALDTLRLQRLSPRERAAEVYLRMWRLAQQLQLTLHAGDTPYELVAALAARVREVSEQAHRQSFGLRLVHDLDQMTQCIVDHSFRPSPPMDRDILSDWRSLSWRLRLAGLLQHWNAIVAGSRTPLG